MNYFHAQELLDRRRAGADMPASQVLKALEMTGDYLCDFSPIVLQEVHEGMRLERETPARKGMPA